MKSFEKTLEECKSDIIHVWQNDGISSTARIAMIKAVRNRLVKTGSQSDEVMNLIGLIGTGLAYLETL